MTSQVMDHTDGENSIEEIVSIGQMEIVGDDNGQIRVFLSGDFTQRLTPIAADGEEI